MGERRLDGVLYLLVGENSFTIRGQTRSVSNWLKILSYEEGRENFQTCTYKCRFMILWGSVWFRRNSIPHSSYGSILIPTLYTNKRQVLMKHMYECKEGKSYNYGEYGKYFTTHIHTLTKTIGNDLSTISSSSRPRASSRSRDEGSQAGGSPFVRKQISYNE